MLTNSGKELNPKLPKDLKYFGGLRAYLLFQQCMLYGVLKALLLASAIYITVVEDHTAYSYCIAALSLLGAVVGLETTFVAFAFWVYGLPYFATTLAYPVASALCPHQTDQIVNPINGSTSYVILERAWDRAAWL